jgi:hypothetical protein
MGFSYLTAMREMVERDLLEREGNTYTITDEGLAYAVAAVSPDESPKRDVLSSIQAFNRSQRDRLGDNCLLRGPTLGIILQVKKDRGG